MISSGCLKVMFIVLILFTSFCLNGYEICLLYTSDAADDLLCVDLGGRRIIKKKKEEKDSVAAEIEKKEQ